MKTEIQPSFKYRAFISYSHRDKAWGDWLHRKLETYKVPKVLAGRESSFGAPVESRLYPVFRDREELPTSSDLGAQIEAAIEASAFLIVVCSPNSAKSRWVNEEIIAFKRAGREGRILAIIVDGEPNATDRPDGGEEECFPQALRFAIGADGNMTEERTEPIAADARACGDGRDDAFLKLAAGLLGVGFDDLKRRDHERKVRRLRAFVAATTFLVAVFALLGVALYFQKNEAEVQRKQAEEQRNVARRETHRAEEKEEEVRQTLAQADYSLALERIDDGVPDLALAHLARAIRTAGHRDSGMRAALLLQQRGWARPVGPVLRSESRGGYRDAVFSQDGKRLALATEEGELEIRDAVSLERIAGSIDLGESTFTWHKWPNEEGPPRKEMRDRDSFVMRFTPEGKHLVATYGNYPMNGDNFTDLYQCLRVWDAETGEPVTEELRGDFFLMEMNRAGTMVVASYGKNCRLYSLPDLTLLHEFEGYAHAFEFSPDGKRLLTVGDEVKIRDTATGAQLQSYTGVGATACFIGDGRGIGLAADGLVGIVHTGDATKNSGYAHGFPAIYDLTVLPEESKLLFRTEDRIYRCDVALKIHTEIFHNEAGIRNVTLSPDGRRATVGCGDGTFSVIDVTREEPFGGRRLTEPLSLSRGRVSQGTLDGINIKSLAVTSPDGKYVMGIAADGSVCLFRLRMTRAGAFPSGRPALPGFAERPENVWDFSAVTPSEDRVLAVMRDAEMWKRKPEDSYLGARLLAIPGLDPVSEELTGPASFLAADFSKDAGRAVISASDASVYVWDLAAGMRLQHFTDTSKDFSHVGISADGETVAYTSFRYREGGGWKGGITLRDAVGGGEIRFIDTGGATGQVRFGPQGRQLAMASGSDMTGTGFLEIWDATTGERIGGRFGGDTDLAFSTVAFSNDGRFLLVSSHDWYEIWALETRRRVSDRFPRHWFTNQDGWISARFRSKDSMLSLLGKDMDLAPAGNPPAWFADLLEAVCGQRIAQGGIPEALPDAHAVLVSSREMLAGLPEDDGWANLARWFLEEEALRRVSPSTDLTVEEFVKGCEGEIRKLGEEGDFFADRIRMEIRMVFPEWVESGP